MARGAVGGAEGGWTEEEFLPLEADKSGWDKGGEGRGTFIDEQVEEEEEHHQGCRVTEQFRVLDGLKWTPGKNVRHVNILTFNHP